MIGRTNTGGGGGGGLNFKVVGGTTAPSNPKENMIWINTSTAITDWVFSATQPTAASGRVWISIGTSSANEFNALKKNGIQVYPISAKQYVSGAWVDKTAKSYQNGAWVDWFNGDIYIDGEFSKITGFDVDNATVTYSNNLITIATKGNVYGSACSKEMININGVRDIVVVLETGSQTYIKDGNAGIGVSRTTIGQKHNSYVSMVNFTKLTFSGEFVINVEGVGGNVYLGATLAGSNDLSGLNGKLIISEIRMRR